MENWWVRKKEEGEREWESNGDRGIEEVEIEEGEIKGEIREGEMEEVKSGEVPWLTRNLVVELSN